jgi:AraC family transcriptional regulator
MATQGFIKTVGDECQEAPLNYRNQVLHSMTSKFCRDETDSGLSIKYVVSGVERYKIGSQWHHITDGRFLLVNEHQNFQCRVESKELVEGLCIYIDPGLLYGIADARQKGHGQLLEEEGQVNPSQVLFLEKIYSLQENVLGAYLHKTVPMLRNQPGYAPMDAQQFFIQLSECLLDSQGHTNELLGRLDQERVSTREEVFRRVSLARQHIDANFLEEINLDEMASQAHFSKYHFLRCFKQVYGMSPYQYVLQRRLNTAKEQLGKTKRSLNEIAVDTGFGDRRAFNKAFRKAFGFNPAELRNC